MLEQQRPRCHIPIHAQADNFRNEVQGYEQYAVRHPGRGLQFHPPTVQNGPPVVDHQHRQPIAVQKRHHGKIRVVHDEAELLLQDRSRQAEAAAQQRQRGARRNDPSVNAKFYGCVGDSRSTPAR